MRQLTRRRHPYSAVLLKKMELPEQLKDALLENNNSEVYEALGVSSFYPLRQPLSGKQPDQYYKFFSAVCSRVRRTACSVRIAHRGLPGCRSYRAEPSLAGAVLGAREGDLFRLDCSTAYYTVLGNGDW